MREEQRLKALELAVKVLGVAHERRVLEVAQMFLEFSTGNVEAAEKWACRCAAPPQKKRYFACAADADLTVMWENAAGSRLLCQPHFDPNVGPNFGPMRWHRLE